MKRISQPIQDFIDGVALSQYSSVAGWQDGDHIYHELGDVTVGGVTYQNVVSRYTISSEAWTVYSYPTTFLCSSQYNDGSTLFQLTGDDGGSVLKMNVGITDNTTPITYSLITRWYTLDGFYSTRKVISKMNAMHTKMEGAKIEWQVGDDTINAWKPLFQIERELNHPQTVDIKGRKIRFRVSGVSSGEPGTFYGLEVMALSSEQFI